VTDNLPAARPPSTPPAAPADAQKAVARRRGAAPTRSTAARRTPAPRDARGLPARTSRAAQVEGRAQEEALALARRIVDLAEDKKASDIVLLEVRELTTLTDYFVICSGGSERQLGSIADGIAEGLKAEGSRPIGREGGANAHWVLLDYGSVIVHVMASPERDYYALEKLWSEAPLLLRVL
jgi:ribosome-associated protein